MRSVLTIIKFTSNKRLNTFICTYFILSNPSPRVRFLTHYARVSRYVSVFHFAVIPVRIESSIKR